MKILENVSQGSPLWLDIRAKHFCASDAPAAMGVSKYKQRSALLREKATGVSEEIDPIKQKLFDAGHAAEDAARSVVEGILSEELPPVTVTAEIDGLPLLASLDGFTITGDIAWENKLFNADLAAAVDSGELTPHYWAQLEHQLLVAGAEKTYFTTSDGTPERTKGMWYVSVPERRAQVIAAWKQFAEDLANYQHVEVLPPTVAEPVMALPALSIQVNGSIALQSNLTLFGEKLKAFIEGIDKNPSDDQAFANAEAAVKTLQTAQDALEAAEQSALAQTASIDDMRRTVALYSDLARTTRLTLEKLVKVRKETIREEIRVLGVHAFGLHMDSMNARMGKPYMPVIQADFAGVMKGKKTIASLRDAVNTELARAKIEASAVADRIQINLATLIELASAHKFLFADTAQLVLKANDDLTAVIKSRIADHQQAEQKRLDAERAKIREEEEAKARAAVAIPTPPLQPAQPAAPSVWMQSDHLNKLITQQCGSQSMLARCSDHQLQTDYRPLYTAPQSGAREGMLKAAEICMNMTKDIVCPEECAESAEADFAAKLAALMRHYGAEVRKGAADVCRKLVLESSTVGEAHAQAALNAMAHDCANAIDRMALP